MAITFARLSPLPQRPVRTGATGARAGVVDDEETSVVLTPQRRRRPSSRPRPLRWSPEVQGPWQSSAGRDGRSHHRHGDLAHGSAVGTRHHDDTRTWLGGQLEGGRLPDAPALLGDDRLRRRQIAVAHTIDGIATTERCLQPRTDGPSAPKNGDLLTWAELGRAQRDLRVRGRPPRRGRRPVGEDQRQQNCRNSSQLLH